MKTQSMLAITIWKTAVRIPVDVLKQIFSYRNLLRTNECRRQYVSFTLESFMLLVFFIILMIKESPDIFNFNSRLDST